MRYKTKPFEHQEKVLDLSWKQKFFALFMEMGTGKSKIIIDNITALYDQGSIDSVFILSTKGSYLNWLTKEVPAHMPEDISLLTAAWRSPLRKKDTESIKTLVLDKSSKLKIFIANIDAVNSEKGYRVFEKYGKLHGAKGMMVVDESSTIKNPKARRTKAVIKLGLLFKYRRVLTGSAVTNSPLDVYSQSEFLHKGAVGYNNFYSFRSRYANMITMNHGHRSFQRVVGYRDLEDLKVRLRNFSVFIKKQDCLDLPDKVYQTRDVELTPEQKKLYEKMKKDAYASLDGQLITAPMVITRLLRLHTIVCGFIKDDEDNIAPIKNNRLSCLMDTLEEVDGKSIIWANYIANIETISKSLVDKFGDRSTVLYYGATGNDARAEALSRFKEDPECRFFVSNPQTGGHGLTLTEATTHIYYSNNYNLELREQSEDRSHRIGQTSKVTYIDLISRGTVDEKIIKALKDKRKLADMITESSWKDLI